MAGLSFSSESKNEDGSYSVSASSTSFGTPSRDSVSSRSAGEAAASASTGSTSFGTPSRDSVASRSAGEAAASATPVPSSTPVTNTASGSSDSSPYSGADFGSDFDAEFEAAEAASETVKNASRAESVRIGSDGSATTYDPYQGVLNKGAETEIKDVDAYFDAAIKLDLALNKAVKNNQFFVSDRYNVGWAYNKEGDLRTTEAAAETFSRAAGRPFNPTTMGPPQTPTESAPSGKVGEVVNKIKSYFGADTERNYIVKPDTSPYNAVVGEVVDDFPVVDTLGNLIFGKVGVGMDTARYRDAATGETGVYSYGSFLGNERSKLYTEEEWKNRDTGTYTGSSSEDEYSARQAAEAEKTATETKDTEEEVKIADPYLWWKRYYNRGRPTGLKDIMSGSRRYNPYLNPYYETSKKALENDPANPYVQARAAQKKAYGGVVKKMASGGVAGKHVDVSSFINNEENIRREPLKYMMNPARAANPEQEKAIVDYNEFILGIADGRYARNPSTFAEGGMAVAQQPGQQVAPPPQQAPQPQQAQPGFVQGQTPEQTPDGQTVADDVPMEVEEGTYVINAAAVEQAGSADVKKMLLDAMQEAEKQGLDILGNDNKINKDNAVSILVSRGEVVVPPALARIIGYDLLEKINNRGKQATQEKMAEQEQQPPQQ